MSKMLVATNPSRRKRRQTAAQKRASMANLRKARSARKRSSAPKRRSTSRRRTATRKNRAPARKAAPRRSTRRAPMRRRSNPARRRIVPRNMMQTHVRPALTGGAGAVLNDVGYNVILNAVPAGMGGDFVEQFRTGYMRHVGKAASALLMAWAAGFVVNRRTADTMGIGALTVIGYNVARDVVGMVAPQLPLGAYIQPGGRGRLGYPGAGYIARGNYNATQGRRSGLQAYVRPTAQRNRLRGVQRSGQFGVRPQLDVPNWYGGRSAPPAPEGYTEDQGA